MARTELTAVAAPGGYADAGVVVTGVAGDVANGNYVDHTGKVAIIAHNTDGATPYDITLTSAEDQYGRTEDLVEEIAAGASHFFGPFPLAGWVQTGKEFYIDVENAAITVAVVKL